MAAIDKRAYWVWLQQGFGEGSRMPWKIHRDYAGGVKEFHEGGPRLWNTRRDITDQQAASLYSFSLDLAQARLEYALKAGWKVYTPECEKYPEALRNISDPPAALYVKGKLPNVDKIPTVAIVGAREARDDSVKAAEKIGFQLAAGGATVVSGGARGIDRAALMGALSAEGKAISVLPVDISSPYIAENASLRAAIPRRGGALVSEFFSQRSPLHGTFHLRNRLITGLSCGVVLIQASMKSGTMIYSRFAKEQDRDVFVYPGPYFHSGNPCEPPYPDDPGYAGSFSLLEDGALPAYCGEDILKEYALRFQKTGNDKILAGVFDSLKAHFSREAVLADSGRAVSNYSGLSPNSRLVMEALEEGALNVLQLEERTGLQASALLGILTELELEEYVSSEPGKRYRKR